MIFIDYSYIRDKTMRGVVICRMVKGRQSVSGLFAYANNPIAVQEVIRGYQAAWQILGEKPPVNDNHRSQSHITIISFQVFGENF